MDMEATLDEKRSKAAFQALSRMAGIGGQGWPVSGWVG